MDSHLYRTLLSRFHQDKSGNFAVSFALAATVIFMAAGLAVDYSRSLGTKTRINNALDAASLATSRALSIGEIGTTGKDAENYFKAVFAANVGDDSFDSGTYTLKSFKLNTNTRTVSAEISVDQPLTFLRVGTGRPTQSVASYSATSYGIGSIEVAMVLDVTGSMGSGTGSKLQSLKDAATLGITELLKANTATDENVRISLVPYDFGVNAGVLAKYVYPDYDEAESDAPVYDASFAAGYDVDTFQAPYKTNCYYTQNEDRSPAFQYARYDGAGYEGLLMNAVFSGSRDRRIGGEGLLRPVHHKTYTCFLPTDFIVEDDGTNVDNCATDRKAPKSSGLTSYQYTDENPSKGMISRDSRLDRQAHYHYSRYYYYRCPSSPLVTLTSNETTLKNAISGLSGGGFTAGHIGLQWAWYTLSHKWAGYIDGTASDPGDMDTDDDLAKFIILMTDGDFNTAYAGTNSSKITKQSKRSKNHTDKLCTNIKAAGIKIFTIGYKTSGAADTMLASCASPDEGNFTYSYEPDTASELAGTYAAIVGMIRTIRLTE